MSKVLRRRRDIFEDELCLRTGRTMTPTGTAVKRAQTIGRPPGADPGSAPVRAELQPCDIEAIVRVGFPGIVSVGVLPGCLVACAGRRLP